MEYWPGTEWNKKERFKSTMDNIKRNSIRRNRLIVRHKGHAMWGGEVSV